MITATPVLARELPPELLAASLFQEIIGGHQVLRAVLPLSRAHGITEAVIEVGDDNRAARAMLEAAGAEAVPYRSARAKGRRRFVLATG